MAYVASELIEEVTAHAQSDSLEDAREICADGTYFPNNLHTYIHTNIHTYIPWIYKYVTQTTRCVTIHEYTNIHSNTITKIICEFLNIKVLRGTKEFFVFNQPQ